MREGRMVTNRARTATGLYVPVLVGCVIVLLSSCDNNNKRTSAVRIVAEWTGKEMIFPQGISCTSIGTDTTCVDLYNDNYKIVLYVDSIGCTSCILRLSEWKKIMNESDSAFIRKPEFVFFFQPKRKDERELLSIFRQNAFFHPVFIDKENEIGKLNRLPSNIEYQCFLIDKDNRVVMIGNPANNPSIWVLYKRIISENKTRVLTTEKGGEFFMTNETTTLPPQLPLAGRKETAKEQN